MNRDTILIFEDNAIDREILVELFRSDYKILEAENGREGIALLKDNIASIAVVLLDNMMPVMDGFKVLEHLKQKHIVSRIPFIMITSENSHDVEAEKATSTASSAISQSLINPMSSDRLSAMRSAGSSTKCSWK